MYGGPPINGIHALLPPIWGVNRGKTAHNRSCSTGGLGAGGDRCSRKKEVVDEELSEKLSPGPNHPRFGEDMSVMDRG